MLTQKEIDRISHLAMKLKRGGNWEEGKRLDESAEQLRQILAQRQRNAKMRRY